MKINRLMKIVDLHVHSNKSDGTYTPAQLVEYAVKKGLTAFALTDHDTTEGLTEAISAARGTDLEVIPGIELSTEYEGKDIHILGLYIDYEAPVFREHIRRFVESRILRNRKMCQNLSGAGMDISYEKLLEQFPGAVITRAHYAKYMLKMGYIKSISEAFERYIGDNCPYFVPREKVTPFDAVRLILQAGGLPVLAHPTLYHMDEERLCALIKQLKEAGLVGMETVYSTYSPPETRKMKSIAGKFGLLECGGSDFHGGTKPGLDLATGYGHLEVPADILVKLKTRLASGKTRIFFTDLDGTLLNDEKNISPLTSRTLRLMTQKGHKLALNSGRPLESILEVVHGQGLNQPDIYIIAYNGCLVYETDTQSAIFEKRLTFGQVRLAMETAAQFGLHCHTYMPDFIVSPADTPELAYYRKTIHLPARIEPDVTTVLDRPPHKCIAISLKEHDKLEAFRLELRKRSEGSLSLIYSNPDYLEIFPAQAGKGKAMHALCDHLHIPYYCSMAAGDQENDISMLRAAGLGVAMANGSDKVKEAATVITCSDNNHDGLVEPLTQFFEL